MRRWMPWAGSALAASIVAALLLVGQPAPQNGQPGGEALIAEKGASPSVRVAGDGYRTGIGEQRTFELADGSKVTLNTATEIRSEEHTSELQPLMRISYAVSCLTKKSTHTRRQFSATPLTQSQNQK